MAEMNGIEWNLDAQAVGRIVLNQPEHHNALGLKNVPALVKAIDEVLAGQPRVIVIEARGPIFCAGGDIREFVNAGDQLDELVDEILNQLVPAYIKLVQAPCPIITVVGGPVGGAGLGLALCGDFVLASDTMKLRTGYAAIGLSPDVGASYFLARRVGALRAQQWLMLSDAIDSQRCLAAGAVDHVFPFAELNAAAQTLVERLCASAPASLAAMKRLSQEGPSLSLQAYLSFEQQLLKACARTADAREGTSAFVAKRQPMFTGR
ncbi:enoyl-CoA hydratase-related protein [Ottowia thiooxydans]|uniref:enoyl-CoA hydratase-related protein n=1 Tax=Ottowia thiooxydans TaxID=219182 RepID=UPI0003FDA6F8|nr:enoyl-CoA hydratase-related protein [Ottowia thiooxydans]